MKTILIIGAGDFQLPLVQRAAQRYEVALAAPEIGAAFQPYLTHSLLTDVRNQSEILRFARELEVCGVITDQTDVAVRTVAYVGGTAGPAGHRLRNQLPVHRQTADAGKNGPAGHSAAA